MKLEKLKESLAKQDFSINFVVFTEAGYEVKIESGQTEDGIQSVCETWLDNLEKVEFDGFMLSDIEVSKKDISVLLVPKTFEEMNDFIWQYVKKCGSRNKRLVDILYEATYILEKAIDAVPNLKTDESIQKKVEAYRNFQKFKNHIF